MIMDDAVAWLTGDGYTRRPDQGLRRWGRVHGPAVVHGQRLPIRRPRVRNQRREGKLDSYEPFRQEEAMKGRPRFGQAHPKTGQCLTNS
jgi:hypothetical protein